MRTVAAILVMTITAGCAAKQLAPGAESVWVSRSEPDASCTYLGEVRGTQGSFWTADFTSDENLILGAKNELRNDALELGADYVHISVESLSPNTADDSSGGLYAAVYTGDAYRCRQSPYVVRR